MTDTDLLERLAPLRALEPTPDETRAVVETARSLRARPAPRRRPARAVAAVALAAAVAGIVLALLPGGGDGGPRDARGIFGAAAAAASDAPAPPGPFRYTRVLDQFVDTVAAGDEHGRVTYSQTTENWTSDAFRGRTVARQGSATWDREPSAALQGAAGSGGAVVKAYDGDYRYGDGPLARVPFAAIPTDAQAAAALLDAAIRDGRWLPERAGKPNWAPGVVESEVPRAAVLLLGMGNLSGDQRAALFGLLGSRPGAQALGEVADATGRRGEGVELPLADGARLRVIVDADSGDILQSTEVLAPPPEKLDVPAGAPRPKVWPPPVALAERTEVFLSTGRVAALGDRP